jgi:replication factor C subunit 1
MTFREKMDMFFIDYDLIPLLVHENYLSTFKDPQKDDINILVKMTEHISVSDLLEKKIRSQQEWNLLQNKGFHSCLAVGTLLKGSIGYPKFPE